MSNGSACSKSELATHSQSSGSKLEFVWNLMAVSWFLDLRCGVQWPPATIPSATGTTPASVSASRSSRQLLKRKTCSCRWPRRGGDWLNKPRAREIRTPIELVPLIRNEPGEYSQQHSTGPG